MKPKLKEMDELLQSHDVQLADIVHNVKNYGAKGDGTTDDTIAIQNAINATLSINGGRLFFPNGTYKISNYINIPFSTGFIIEGQSRLGVIIKQHADNTPIFRFTTAMTHSWKIQNIDFEYNNAQSVSNTLAISLYFALDSGLGGNGYFNFEIESCTFNSGYYGISQRTDSQGITLWGVNIKNCTFGGSLSGGAIYISPNPSIGQPEINIENCYINCSNMTQKAIFITSCDSVLLKSVEYNGGSYTQGQNTQMEISSCYVTLINCRSEAMALNGSIILWNFSNSYVTMIGCTIGSATINASSNATLVSAGTGGRIAVHGLIVGGTLGSGASATAVYSDNLIVVENLIALNGFARYLSYTNLPKIDCDNLQPIKTQVRGDVTVSLSITDFPLQYFNTTFTANRTITLPSTGLYDGLTFTIVKWVSDAYTLQVIDSVSGKNITLPANARTSVTYRATSNSEWLRTQLSTL